MTGTIRCADVVRLLTALSFLVVFPGCRKPPSAVPAVPEVTVAVPIRQPVRSFYDVTGNTEAIEAADIQARVEGILEKAHFADGSDVKEGDLLFSIEKAVYQAGVERASAALESSIAELKRAQANYKRVASALQNKAVSEQEMDLKEADRDVAQAAVSQAQAELAQAQLQLGYTEIRSPITGRISRGYVDEGNLVGSGERTRLARVVQFDPIHVYFRLSETLLSAHLQKKAADNLPAAVGRVKFHLRLPGKSEYTEEGEIDYIDNEIDPSTGTVEVRGVLANGRRLLYPGMFVQIRIQSPAEESALLVYEKAIGTDLGGKYLLIVGGNHLVERRYIEPGQLYGDKRVIEKGIQDGESYIVTGIQRARPGLPVTPVALPAEETDKPQATGESQTVPYAVLWNRK